MRYFKLFWDGLYAFTLGSLAAAGFAMSCLSIKRCIEKQPKKDKES